MTSDTLYLKRRFAVTITLNPRLFIDSRVVQREITERHLLDVLNSFGECETFTCVAESTKRHNIHYHVFLQFKHKFTCKHVKETLIQELKAYDNKFGFIDVKLLTTDEETDLWLKYMIKNIKDEEYLF